MTFLCCDLFDSSSSILHFSLQRRLGCDFSLYSFVFRFLFFWRMLQASLETIPHATTRNSSSKASCCAQAPTQPQTLLANNQSNKQTKQPNNFWPPPWLTLAPSRDDTRSPHTPLNNINRYQEKRIWDNLRSSKKRKTTSLANPPALHSTEKKRKISQQQDKKKKKNPIISLSSSLSQLISSSKSLSFTSSWIA